ANVRIGYAWHWNVDFAVEGGYANLGKLKTSWSEEFDKVYTSSKAQGLFIGAKVKYGFGSSWYVSARGGFLQGIIKQNGNGSYDNGSGTWVSDSFSNKSNHLGEYVGVGIGYDLTRQFSIGLNYDYYHNK